LRDGLVVDLIRDGMNSVEDGQGMTGAGSGGIQQSQSSGKTCVLQVTETELQRVNEWLKSLKTGKPMSRLSQEMLSMKIDKNFKQDIGLAGTNLPGILQETIDVCQGLSNLITEKDKIIEGLTSQLKSKSDEAEKMKGQLTQVLVQFKGEREKNSQKIIELQGIIKEKEEAFAECDKARASAEQGRNAKVEETIAKLFEKTAEMTKLREELENTGRLLEESQGKLAKTEDQLRGVLAVDNGGECPSGTLPHVYSLVINKNVRSKLLGFLGIQDLFLLRSSSRFLHRAFGFDLSLVQSIEQMFRKRYNRDTELTKRTMGT
jgi:hypothetical protein